MKLNKEQHRDKIYVSKFCIIFALKEIQAVSFLLIIFTMDSVKQKRFNEINHTPSHNNALFFYFNKY